MREYTPDFDTVGGVADFLTLKGRVHAPSGPSHQTSIRIPTWTWLRLKAIAEANDMSVSEVIVLFVDAGLEESRAKLLEAGLDIEKEAQEWAKKLSEKAAQ